MDMVVDSVSIVKYRVKAGKDKEFGDNQSLMKSPKMKPIKRTTYSFLKNSII
jgi:hypothetical protein